MLLKTEYIVTSEMMQMQSPQVLDDFVGRDMSEALGSSILNMIKPSLSKYQPDNGDMLKEIRVQVFKEEDANDMLEILKIVARDAPYELSSKAKAAIRKF